MLKVELVLPNSAQYEQACEFTAQLFRERLEVELSTFEPRLVVLLDSKSKIVGSLGLTRGDEVEMLPGEAIVSPRDLLQELSIDRRSLGQIGQLSVYSEYRHPGVHLLIQAILAFAATEGLSHWVSFFGGPVLKHLKGAAIPFRVLDPNPDIRNPALGFTPQQIQMWEKIYWQQSPALYGFEIRPTLAACNAYLLSQNVRLEYGEKLRGALNPAV